MDAWMLTVLASDTPATLAKYACDVARRSDHNYYFMWKGLRVEVGPTANRDQLEKSLEEVSGER